MSIIYPIQSLRGFSILLIILYHYYPKLFSSGFLGVTLFLEMSGLVNNKPDIEFNTFYFYVKRLNTIYPSLLTVVLLVEYLMKNFSYNELLNFYCECKYVLKGYVNYYFYKKSIDYFHQFDNPSLILHFWYISLQVQIYVIFPLVKKMANSITIVTIILSYTIYTYYSIYYKNKSYYLLESRLYEFLIGYCAKNSRNYSSLINNKFVFYALIYIILCLSIYCKSNISFYTTSIISVIGYVILINIVNMSNFKKCILLDLLGKYSFQLYLIHYPLIYLIQSNIYIKFLCTLFLSLIIKLIVNIIINTKQNFKIAVIILSFTIFQYKYFKYKEDSINKKKNNLLYIPKEDPLNEYYKVLNMFKLTTISKIPKNNVIFLLCDSHGQQWFPSIIYITKAYGFNLLHIYFHADIIEKQRYHALISIIKCQEKMCNNIIISAFYISNRWINKFNIFNSSFILYGKLLSSIVSYIIFIQDIPFLHSDPMKCIYSDKLKDECKSIIGVNASFYSLPIISLKNIHYCNMNNYICPNRICNYLYKNKYIKYKDFNHLTLSYSYQLTNYLKKKCISFINKTNIINRSTLKIKLFS